MEPRLLGPAARELKKNSLMRSDMHKVICEEPRHGGGPEKHSRSANLPEELLPKFEGIRQPHKDRKRFGEHLGPLRRWLRSQIGRPWSDVYGEACAVIKPDSVVRNHIKFHLLQFVQRYTFMRDRRVWCFTTHWSRNEIPVDEAASRWSPFYVHPESGLLCEVISRRRARWENQEKERRAKTQRWLSNNALLRQLNGLWFECAVESFPDRFVRGDEPMRFDMAERRLIGPGQAKKVYGRKVFCFAKRQLSRRELRQCGLNNSAQTLNATRQ
jgi:hypothetical protein